MIDEFRRAPRRKVGDTILVTDVMSERVIGRIGNLSETGMLLIVSETLVDDALYQVSFPLATPSGKDVQVEAGVHLLWTDHASAPGQAWAGLRFIALTDAATTYLRDWIAAPGGHFE